MLLTALRMKYLGRSEEYVFVFVPVTMRAILF